MTLLGYGRQVYFTARPLPEGAIATRALVPVTTSWEIPEQSSI
ncbi:MAG: hypothetical protein QM729_03105 [Solirubrobacterales bacterium]